MIDRRFAPLLLAVSVAMLTSATAQTVPPPEDAGPILGMYTTSTINDDTDVAMHASQLPSTIRIHIVLSDPGIEAVSGAMFRIERSDELVAASSFVDADNGHPAWEYWDFPNIGWVVATPRPVVGAQVWLLRFDLRIIAPVAEGLLYLVPHPGIPGFMQFVGPGDTAARTMLPNSEDLAFDNPVFRVSAGTVSNASRTFSAVKSLFRGAATGP